MNPKKFQEKPIAFVADKLRQNKSALLISPTGSGKTFMMTSALSAIQAEGLHKTKGHEPLIITPNALQEHWRRHCIEMKVKARIFSYEQLRSTTGELLFIDWVPSIKFGRETTEAVFKNNPSAIILDEVQKAKNPETATAQACFAAVNANIPILACSATPFAKLSESEFMVRALTKTDRYDFMRLANELCAYGKAPEDYSPKNMENLSNYLESRNYLYKVNDARFPYPASTTAVATQLDKHKMLLYNIAYEEYRKELAKLNKFEPEGIRAIWVAMLKFWQKSELLMADSFAARIYQALEEGYQPCFAANFVDTLVAVTKLLFDKYEIGASKIALIVGGQKKEERQANIDAFNNGDKPLCLMTMKTGGLGVDLPHSKDNGKACPRKVIIPVCWSPMSYLQALGRCHRMNSISRTDQEVIYADNTIQARIADRVMSGTRSLAKVMSRATQIIDILNDEIISEGLHDIAEEESLNTDEDGDNTENYDGGMFQE